VRFNHLIKEFFAEMSINIGSEIARLNPKQREAVEKTEGPLLILAGAGSGKTRVITLRVAYLMYSGVQPEAVLAVTFTNKAANEMKERVVSMLQSRKGKTPTISTFHSLCLNILRREIHQLGYRKNFIIYDSSEQLSLLRSLLSDIRAYDRSFKPDAIMEQISRIKNEFAASGGTPELEEFTGIVYPRYQEMLRELWIRRPPSADHTAFRSILLYFRNTRRGSTISWWTSTRTPTRCSMNS
jgi:DNA helicase-2/ATP-dependent DNA helicase PcrA